MFSITKIVELNGRHASLSLGQIQTYTVYGIQYVISYIILPYNTISFNFVLVDMRLGHQEFY